jgi:MarR family transcriptional regulator, organic hydroperoxide resistance regulator
MLSILLSALMISNLRESPYPDVVAEPPTDSPPEEWPLGRLLFTATRMVEHHHAEHLRTWDLTNAGFIVLALLLAGPLTQREIAHRAMVEEQTISRTLERLERQGYVVRHRDEHDRRRMLVANTRNGHVAVRQASRHDVVEEALGPEADLQRLKSQLAAVIRRLHPDGIAPPP